MKVRAPGRVNLIGEHTDYNQGFVLPIALSLETSITTTTSPDGAFHVYSVAKNEMRSWTDFAEATPQRDWTDYVIGVAKQLPFQPISLHIESTVPEGAGLSSSAALEVAAALALLDGFHGCIATRALDGLCHRRRETTPVPADFPAHREHRAGRCRP